MSVRVIHGGSVRPCLGFTSCGDATAVVESADSSLYLVVDALGHGPDAERSAQEACAALQTLGAATLQEAFRVVDRALADRREAVMAGIQINREGSALFAGIGNVEVIGPFESARPVCQVGRVGRGLRTLRETPVAIAPGSRWLLASDGIRSRQLRAVFDSTRSLAPAEAALRVIELAARETDDASTLILDVEAADGD
jgi:hypothetical protein